MDKDVIFQEHSGTGWVILNRPRALNALSLQMVTDIYNKLKEWSENESIALVCIKSQIEKAFCSGGDIRSICEMAKINKSSTFFKEYFSTEYKMDLLVHEYPKPILAFMEGVVMGGGVGLSIGAKFRIMTERTKWAMPEMNIGFFPDVGASYFLNQMPGKVGTYLALTAKVLTAGDILYTNAANYYLMSSDLHKVEDFIRSFSWRKGTVEEPLTSFLESICMKQEQVSISLDEKRINQHFQYKSMEEIIESLDEATENGDKWAEETRSLLLQKSPTSLKVTLELMQRGIEYTLEESYETDVILAQNFLHTNDFHEGVRAVLVDKDHSPKWNPDSLNNVSNEYVNSFFLF
ncbi:enoyl-CoA hydratase/isomerase family protein [Bacillus sp. FJAT-49705]|uniref:3-hydroxyisobutyryl-CoA hydrolase n=1 Tax=Cytobacillus citreus TaxID=2833586 RepID=A0ABS5NV29_9BACI|nr:enoyl-CoA hydratase/isomerase family protein [Cytobacillus citreus]MBS4191679.1 enoyl-CoA hydratase/isomerase family protein [Cytobacillus citreus]